MERLAEDPVLENTNDKLVAYEIDRIIIENGGIVDTKKEWGRIRAGKKDPDKLKGIIFHLCSASLRKCLYGLAQLHISVCTLCTLLFCFPIFCIELLRAYL